MSIHMMSDDDVTVDLNSDWKSIGIQRGDLVIFCCLLLMAVMQSFKNPKKIALIRNKMRYLFCRSLYLFSFKGNLGISFFRSLNDVLNWKVSKVSSKQFAQSAELDKLQVSMVSIFISFFSRISLFFVFHMFFVDI